MKTATSTTTSLASFLVLLFLCISTVTAVLEPRATAAPHHHRRDSIKDGLDISAILANPSSYLKEASSLFNKNPKLASKFAEATARPAFLKSISKELVSQFGSKTASIALQQYTAVLAAQETAAAQSDSGSSSNNGAAANNVVSVTSTLGASDASSTGTTSDSVVAGSPSGAAATLLFSTVAAVSCGAAVVMLSLVM